jgi:uncharacterized membrane protein (TIGR02234 family)
VNAPSARVAYLAALVLDALGAGAVLLIALRPWQTVVTPRPAPLQDDTLHLSGRTVDSAPTALALVALAGVVAVIATRGTVRRVVGAVLTFAGLAVVWRSVAAAGAISSARARSFVTTHHRSVVVTDTHPRVGVSSAWPVLSVVGGLLVVVAGALVVWQGHRWRAMSSRYEAATAPPDGDLEAREAARQRTAAALWTELDRGLDPTDPTDTTDPARHT